MDSPRTLRVAAERRSLASIRSFVAETARSFQAPPQVTEDMVQAVDEAVTNVILHGYREGPGSVEIQASLEAGALLVRVCDWAPRFDPTQVPPPDLSASIDARCSGGLGIHFVRQCLDSMTYRTRPDGGNELTLRKNLPGKNH